MSETRRQLFKTSVLSVIGIATSPALGRAEPKINEYHREEVFRRLKLEDLTPNSEGTVIAALDGGGTWYFFVFAKDPSNCYLYKAKSTISFPDGVTAEILDTNAWYTNLKSGPGVAQVTDKFDLKIKNLPVWTIDFDKDAPHYLDDKTIRQLYYYLKEDMIIGSSSWNEIGKNNS